MDPSVHPSKREMIRKTLCNDCARMGLSACDFSLHDESNVWPCGCEVVDRFAPVDMSLPNMGLTFKSRCNQHAPKVDSRKADATCEYAFTLTMPPDYEPKKPIEEVARLICENGMTSKPYERPEKWAFVLEHTEKGVPHIHGMYKTPSGRRIEQKYFKRYWPIWDESPKCRMGQGHKGGYHQKARHSESYEAYMEKEGVVCRNKAKPPTPPPELISHV